MSSKRKADESSDETQSKRPFFYFCGGRTEESKRNFDRVSY